MAAMRKHGARNFTTYAGHHPSAARARDVTPHNWGAANAARRLSSVWYVIYKMKIASKNHGNGWRGYTPIRRTGDFRHERHIHVARYGDGTAAARGGLAVVGERGPELVRMKGGESVTPMSQLNYARVGGGASIGTTVIEYHVHAPNYVGDKNGLMQALVTLNRQGRLQVIKR
jgi:hypothetical protein